MQVRKKQEIDGTDRKILMLLCKSRPLVSRQIAEGVGLTPSAISPRLESLKAKGILKKKVSLGIRLFKRSFGGESKLIKSPSSIYWDLDLVKK